jgi:uncharacterized OsmC-like protein
MLVEWGRPREAAGVDPQQGGVPMAESMTTDRVKSYSSGILGRCLNAARTNHFVIDSPSGPSEALTTIEAFLSGISACAVTLVEKQAKELGVPLRRLEVAIEANRTRENPANLHSMALRFELFGLDQQQADRLVGIYKER